MVDKDYFNFSDAWVFQSLIYSTKDETTLDLSHLIAAGDWLNHAILTIDEINDGIIKLQRKGIIKFNNRILKYTELGKTIIEKTKKKKGGLFSRIDITQKELNSITTDQTIEQKLNLFEILTEKEIQLGYLKYK